MRFPSVINSRMVASTHNLDDLGVSHPTSATEEIRQQQQFNEKQSHAFKPPPTAQDKRSRLSNVINNLRKKVPEPSKCESSTKEADDKNSVERNLETLEKYVMTVLNGVIKEEEENNKRESEERVKESIDEKIQEDSKGESEKNFEPAQPNESGMEAAVPDRKRDSDEENNRKKLQEDENKEDEDEKLGSAEIVVKEESNEQVLKKEQQTEDEDASEKKTLGTIIMERLSDNHQDEYPHPSQEEKEAQLICREILNDIIQSMDENIQIKEENSFEEERSLEASSTTSLHCSLPLDKVASVLQACQESRSVNSQSPTKTPTKSNSPTVRHLCLYCDRKFLSISLRQRHTERVHQSGGGRRSERNSRKPSQNCQYCSDRCVENLEGLFQHMVSCHSDKYHGCLQCATRYLTRDALVGHMNDLHSSVSEKNQEKSKENLSTCKDTVIQQVPRESLEDESETPKPPTKDSFSNPGSPEFDSSFYSSVSCNIRENLLHHLDGKLQVSCSNPASMENKSQTPLHEHTSNSSQMQFPIDISLTAATPVYNKDYSSEDYDNSSEYAQKPGKSNRSHPRRVSFEKYNFPRKYDGREQWTCSIKDLSKFDISTQLTLRKKQQMMKDCLTIDRSQTSLQTDVRNNDGQEETGQKDREKVQQEELEETKSAIFSAEFSNFMRVRKWDESKGEKEAPTVYAELTGEWSRPRVYICGACTARYITLKEMEDHKTSSHPNVWCSHFEFSGDQRELYKHLFLPGRSVPTAKARNATLPEKICTKCMKNCNTLAELHRHMLECGGDQAWLLGLFGNGKKKCKWRPFGSRSRRRRQRGMKRNIQNSQTPRVNVPKEKQPSGPRVRPSDRESIQKMLANLPPKRASRKVLQDNVARNQGRLRNVQTKSRTRFVSENSSAKRISHNKAVIRNKLLKNAKSFKRKCCKNDNIAAAIENVVNDQSYENVGITGEGTANTEKSGTRLTRESIKSIEASKLKAGGLKNTVLSKKMTKDVRVLGKRKNIKIKNSTVRHVEMTSKQQKIITVRSKGKLSSKTSTDVSSTLPQRNKQLDLAASLKAKSQPRTHDGKFASKKKQESVVINIGLQGVKTRASNYLARSTSVKITRKNKTKVVLRRTPRSLVDAEKMPMLEPALLQKDAAADVNKSTELPILSPVMSTEQKCPRVSPRNLKKTEQTASGNQIKEEVEENSRNVTDVKEKLKSEDIKGKKSKKSEISTNLENSVDSGTKEPVRMRNKKVATLPKSSIATRKLSLDFKDFEEKIESLKAKTGGEELSRGLKTRSNSRARLERKSLEENSSKAGLAPKEDLLNNLGLKSRDKSMKRASKQLTSKLKKNITAQNKEDLDNEISMKKEKPGIVRKSLRNLEKKNPDLCVAKENDDNNEEGKENTIVPFQEKEEHVDVMTSENELIKEAEPVIEEKLTEQEAAPITIKKRRGRTKTRSLEVDIDFKEVDNEDEISAAVDTVHETNDEEKMKEIPEDFVDSKKEVDLQEKEDATVLVNLNLEHLQQESCSSNVDSGKENSSDVPVSVSKPKVVRPKKVRSQRRERASKRSLSSVIGILTEGVNIPIEAQESVVFTMQTSIDGITSENITQNHEQSLNEVQETPHLEQDNGTSQITDTATIDSTNCDNTKKPDNNSQIAEADTTEPQNEIGEASTVEQQPANDIILDLSRRKTKGKGSFLEKIVSKIAKQKDVTLVEGDANTLDDLTNVLDEVVPDLSNWKENNENTNVPEILDQVENSTLESVLTNVEETRNADDSIIKSDSNTIANSESLSKEEENQNGLEIQQDEESSKTELPKETKRRSTKRPLDGTSPKKNKRKSVEETAPEESQEEIQLADIMSLIDQSSESFSCDDEKVKLGKRKTLEDENETDCVSSTSTESTRKSRRKTGAKKIKSINELSVKTIIELKEITITKENNESNLECAADNQTTNCLNNIENNEEKDLNVSKNEDVKKVNEQLKVETPMKSLKKKKSSQEKESSKSCSANEDSESEKDKEKSCGKNKIKTCFDEHLVLSSPPSVPEIKITNAPSLLETSESSSLRKSCKKKAKPKVDESEGISEVPETSQLTRKQTPKKKSLMDEHLDLVECVSEHEVDNLNSTLNEIITETVCTENGVLQVSSNIDESSFKIPDSSEISQTTKKRSLKKKSLIDEHLDLSDSIANTLITNPAQNSNGIENAFCSEDEENYIKSSATETRSAKRRTSKQKTSVSESSDLSDDVSILDMSVIKKRMSKKKSKMDKISELKDSTVNDNVAELKSGKKIVSLLDEHLDLLDKPEQLLNCSIVVEKSNEIVLKNTTETSETEKITEEVKEIVKENNSKVASEIQNAVNDFTTPSELENTTVEDFQAPNKRPKGNFAVVHTKSGEILIVEKKKKFTKEAAKFFCDVCATSFTRKSSLKKHNQSQSHHLQLAKFGKDQEKKMDQNEEIMKDDSQELSENDDQTTNTIETEKKILESLTESVSINQQDHDITNINLESSSLPTEVKESIKEQMSPEQALEEELLDEEICKITENMSHEEYVLTDHVSPILPEAPSTPTSKGAKKLRKKIAKEKEKEDKKKEKKRNLAEEHLDLNTPDLIEDFDRSISNATSGDFQNYCASLDDFGSVNSINFSTDVISVDKQESVEEESITKIQKSLKCQNTGNKYGKKPGRRSKLMKKLEEDNIFKLLDSDNANTSKSWRAKRNLNTDTYGNQKVNIQNQNMPLETNILKEQDCSKPNDNAVSENKKPGRKSKASKKFEENNEIELSDSNNVNTFESSKANRNLNTDMHENQETKVLDQINGFEHETKKLKEIDDEKQNMALETDTSKEQGTVTKNKKPGRPGRKSKASKKFEENNDFEPSDSDITNAFKNSRPKRNMNFASCDSLDAQILFEIDHFERQGKRTSLRSKKNNDEKLETNNVLENDSDNMKETFLDVKQDTSLKSNIKDKINKKKQSRGKSDDAKIVSETPKFDAFEDIKTLDCSEPLDDIQTLNSAKEADPKNETTESGAFRMFENFNYDLDDCSRISAVETSFEKSQDELVNDSAATEFDSDENSLDTNMSMDIQKIIDDPELSMDTNKQTAWNLRDDVEAEENLNTEVTEKETSEVKKILKSKKNSTKTPKSCIDTNKRIAWSLRDDEKVEENLNSEIEKKKNKEEKEEKETSEVKKTPKSKKNATKTSKSRGKKAKAVCDELNNSECSDSEDRFESQNKRKIVKSVFGRVFAGEKIDKAKEVMEDWESKSATENDVEENSSKASRRKKKENKEDVKRGKSKNCVEENDKQNIEVTTPEPSSRCRQSKKRALELISEYENSEFHFPLSDSEDDEWMKKTSKSKETIQESRIQQKPNVSKTVSQEVNDEYTKEKNQETKKKGRRKSQEENSGEKEQIDPHLNKNEEPATKPPGKLEEFRIDPSFSSMYAINHSPKNSDVEDDDDDDEDENMSCRRMSPIFAYNTLDSSLGDTSQSANEVENNIINNEEEDEGKNEEMLKKSNFVSEFSGDKVVIRSSPSSYEARPELVTIAPTDAIEDNALDVPQEIEMTNSQQKSRQGKVLNFDEELFVECCSRLKATSEKELRGAKKIKLDHSDGYHRKEEQSQIFRGTKDRWRDVESQNSLGSLLESVNQLLGEEMYSTPEKGYEKREQTANSERSSRSASPNLSRMDNLGYEDSLDVAFEHNNKLRDKIQQRMRESENLLANTFGQKNSNLEHHRAGRKNEEYEENRQHSGFMHQQINVSNGIYDDDKNDRKGSLDSLGFKSKMNSTLGGILDKALSNLLHNNSKHDNNGSTPMKVLAELACARAPTSMPSEIKNVPEKPAKSISNVRELIFGSELTNNTKDSVQKKEKRNPIKELFERKKELNDRKQTEKSKIFGKNAETKKSKKPKKLHNFPLIRNSQRGGLAEKKKRRESFDKRESNTTSDKIKDVYDFDDEDTQPNASFFSVLSYRNKVDMANLSHSKNIKESSPIDSTAEKFAPKTKGALKCFQAEDKTEHNGPMDDCVERKQRHKRLEQQKHLKSKKKTKNLKKKQRHAWYENDSSDEFVTAVKTEDIGVGISKSQRTCSKGKQNLFAELSTSSESEFERNEDDEEETNIEGSKEVFLKENDGAYDNANNDEEEKKDDKYENDWMIKEADVKKSESEMSDHPLVIDEKKDSDEIKNSDDDCDMPYERSYDMDDLYREDSSVPEIDSEEEESTKQNVFSHEKIQSNPEQEKSTTIDKNRDLLEKSEDPTNSLRILEKPRKSENSIPESEKNEEEDDDSEQLPEKLTSNEKPQAKSDNLPLHIFLSRKVQESKKRKQQQQELKKLQEAQERILAEMQSSRRQRKCAIGKQGLLAEISSSDEDSEEEIRETERQPRKQKRESKETRKERYLEKQREKRFANEQKAIEEMILRDLKKNKEQISEKEKPVDNKVEKEPEKQCEEQSKRSKSLQRTPKMENKVADKKKKSMGNAERSKSKDKERRNVTNKRDLDDDDEELKTTKSWNKVEEGVGVAIGKRKRAGVKQLYYWSSSSDDEEPAKLACIVDDEEEEDDRQEQHGWIVGDSHKKMITMLAMEKQLKEKRRRSEDEIEAGKGKGKKHRNGSF